MVRTHERLDTTWKRKRGRPRKRWDDIRQFAGPNWTEKATDRQQWQHIHEEGLYPAVAEHEGGLYSAVAEHEGGLYPAVAEHEGGLYPALES